MVMAGCYIEQNQFGAANDFTEKKYGTLSPKIITKMVHI